MLTAQSLVEELGLELAAGELAPEAPVRWVHSTELLDPAPWFSGGESPSTLAIEEMLPQADLVIGAVLVHGARAPHVVTRAQLGLMKERAVLVDVSIDQGGCFETSRPTTHSDPTYEVDGITHYCVTNMPGAVPITSTFALTNATLPYVVALAEHGVRGAIARDPGLRSGVNVAAGLVTHAAVADGTGMPFTPVEEALESAPAPAG